MCFRQARTPVTAEDRPAERAVLETLKNKTWLKTFREKT